MILKLESTNQWPTAAYVTFYPNQIGAGRHLQGSSVTLRCSKSRCRLSVLSRKHGHDQESEQRGRSCIESRQRDQGPSYRHRNRIQVSSETRRGPQGQYELSMCENSSGFTIMWTSRTRRVLHHLGIESSFCLSHLHRCT